MSGIESSSVTESMLASYFGGNDGGVGRCVCGAQAGDRPGTNNGQALPQTTTTDPANTFPTSSRTPTSTTFIHLRRANPYPRSAQAFVRQSNSELEPQTHRLSTTSTGAGCHSSPLVLSSRCPRPAHRITRLRPISPRSGARAMSIGMRTELGGRYREGVQFSYVSYPFSNLLRIDFYTFQLLHYPINHFIMFHVDPNVSHPSPCRLSSFRCTACTHMLGGWSRTSLICQSR